MNNPPTVTVHMIGNAHLDPAWLWTWPAGADEALATCRTACDLLDIYPEFHVTRGEAWVYEQIRTLDPVLFRRIATHVTRGRWHVVNGWWVQPDCNLPGPESFRKHAEIAGRVFKEQLGVSVKVGYNVDSFGHGAMLPTFLREAGMEFYVFMRPNAQETPLPAELFRWRSPVGDEVLAFRIARAYSAAGTGDLQAGLETALAVANRAIGHTMCFYGVGDHGGGPTREQIEWILEHRHYRKDVKLRFSHPQAFFDAVKKKRASLPVVKNELQRNAVGCYTAIHDIKREVRRAEALLTQAGGLLAVADRDIQRALKGRLNEAWKRVLFNQFHDILGGTCIRSACNQTLEELGFAKSVARDVIVELTRRTTVSLPPYPRQRLVVFNPSDRPWHGYAEFEPWLPTDGAPRTFLLTDEKGAAVPLQFLASESAAGLGQNRILFPVKVPVNDHRVFGIRRKSETPAFSSEVRVKGQTLANGRISVTCGPTGLVALAVDDTPLLRSDGVQIGIFPDPSDTWGHDIAGFAPSPLAIFVARGAWTVQETGPLRAAMGNKFAAEDATLLWQVFVEAQSRAVRLRLRLNWRGERRVLKLLLPPAFRVLRHMDGVPGALLERPMDGGEWPVRDVVAVAGKGVCLAALSPDVSGADVQPDGTIRLTLLRSPLYAHHDPFSLPPNHTYPITDQGVHEYEISFLALTSFSEPAVLDEVNRLNNPLWITETTKGMTSGWRYNSLPKAEAKGPPVAPFNALQAEALLACVERPVKATLVPSESVGPEWIGEKVLSADAADVTLAIPVTVEGRYRIAVAHGAGGLFGRVVVSVNGQPLGKLTGAKGKPHGRISLLAESCPLTKGVAKFRFERQGGRLLTLGFLHLAPVYHDIPGNAWMAVGSFLFGSAAGDGSLAGCSAESVIKEVGFPPEVKRDFKAAIPLDDHRKARWRRMTGDGDYVDFLKAFGKRTGSVHYAVTYLRSPRAHSVRFSYGVDYWMKIWLNGQVVQNYATAPGGETKGYFTLEVDLQEGWNELLVKVASGCGGNGFWMAVTDLAGLQFAPQPAGSRRSF